MHEGPHAIAKGNNIPLKPGMILSNEPGYYKPGEYGIRIENLMYVEEKKEGFLGFKQLTCVPLDKKLINISLLTKDEITWINEYHSFVYNMLIDDHIDNQARDWLREASGNISGSTIKVL